MEKPNGEVLFFFKVANNKFNVFNTYGEVISTIETEGLTSSKYTFDNAGPYLVSLLKEKDEFEVQELSSSILISLLSKADLFPENDIVYVIMSGMMLVQHTDMKKVGETTHSTIIPETKEWRNPLAGPIPFWQRGPFTIPSKK